MRRRGPGRARRGLPIARTDRDAVPEPTATPARTRRASLLAAARDRTPELAILLGTLATGAPTLLGADGPLAVIPGVVGYAAIAGGTVASWRASKDRTQLREQIAQFEEVDATRIQWFGEMVDALLQSVADRVGLGNTSRVSLYRHVGGEFNLAGRYARRPEYSEPARVAYPEAEGCLGAAWRSTEEPPRAIARLPDPEIDLDAYVAACQRDWDLPEETTRALRMKSRHLIAYAVPDLRTGRLVGVVVFESTEEEGLNIEDIDAHMARGGANDLGSLLRSPDMPDLREARERGF